MTAVPQEKLDRLVQRWEEIQAQLNHGVGAGTYAQLTKEFADLNPVVEIIRQLHKLEQERTDLAQLLQDPSAEADLKELARDELDLVDRRFAEAREKLRVELL